MKQQNFAVVGAGLMGQLISWRLAQLGQYVNLFERHKDISSSCSWAGAGQLTPFAELEKADPHIAQMGLASMELWRKWLPQLPQPVFFETQGSLVVAHRQDMHDLHAFEANIQRKLTHIPDSEQALQHVDRNALSDLEPELAQRFDRALYLPNEGHLDPRQLLPSLQEALAQHPNVKLRFGIRVRDVQPGEISYYSLIQQCDMIIDTRGLAARQQYPQLRGVRGELLRLHAPEVKLKRPIRLMHPRYPIYIAPRPDDHFLIGATSIESDDQGPLTVKSALELLSAAYSLHSGFAEARVIESQVQCRPAYPDNNPALHYQPGLLRINGLYRHGYLVAPAVVDDALNLLQGQAVRYPQLIATQEASS